jgi:hypothetical protein
MPSDASGPSFGDALFAAAICSMACIVTGEVPIRVGHRPCAFAEHVEAKTQVARAARCDFDSASASSIVCPSTNCLASNCTARKVPATTVFAPSLPSIPGGCAASGSVFFESAITEFESRAIAPSPVPSKVRATQLVGCQRDRGRRIGHAQQRLRKPHQREAFGFADRIFLEQTFHRPERRRVCRAQHSPTGVRRRLRAASRGRRTRQRRCGGRWRVLLGKGWAGACWVASRENFTSRYVIFALTLYSLNFRAHRRIFIGFYA